MPPTSRILAVDAFRGLTIAFMILVNNPGSFNDIYPFLVHASWHGFTPVDFVFPFFLFLVGVSITLSLRRRQPGQKAEWALIRKYLRRAAVLFGLGLFENAYPCFHISVLRIPGVLQRIGVISFLAGTIAVKLRPRAVLMTVIVLLYGYWLIMTLVPIPDIGHPDFSQKTANLAAWLDRTLMGGHLWMHEEEWDPEGVLSTLPALALTLMGVLAGRTLLTDTPARDKIRRFASRGLLLAAAGLFWNFSFPINRWLWTSSFMCVTAGAALFVLAGLIWLTQIAGKGNLLKPFEIFGQNALAIYLGASLLAKSLYMFKTPGGERLHDAIFEALFAPWLPPADASLAYAVSITLLMFGVSYALYVRRIIIRI